MTSLLLVAALATPSICRADDNEPRSLAMVDVGVPMIIFGAIGAVLMSLALPFVLQSPSDGCCGGVTKENLGTFVGVTVGLTASLSTFGGGIALVYIGAQHKGSPNAVITASGLRIRF